jgi:putative nucleotidyltransferase with HDIG domain
MNDKALKIIDTLNHEGHQAFFVGGCVRDFLMGRQPHDFDIVTSAKPEEVEKLFQKCLGVGRQFGITVVMQDGEPFEVATFREDLGSDGRHPDEVRFVTDIVEDLKRRDFTMNAIAMDADNNIIDPCGGFDDIKNKVIRFVGIPADRLAEDSLRALRAIRFQGQLGFKIESKSLEALGQMKNLDGVSPERVSQELTKLMIGDFAIEAVHTLRDTGIMGIIIPETLNLFEPHNSPWHIESDETGNTIWAHVMGVIENACEETVNLANDRKLVIRLAALLHDIGKPASREPRGDHDRFLKHDQIGALMTGNILRNLRFTSEVVSRVTKLVFDHMHAHDFPKIKDVSKKRIFMGRNDIDDLLILAICDSRATINNNDIEGALKGGSESDLLNAVSNFDKVFFRKLPERIVSGIDLISSGFKPCEHFKKALDVAFRAQLRGNGNKEFCLNQAISFLRTKNCEQGN